MIELGIKLWFILNVYLPIIIFTGVVLFIVIAGVYIAACEIYDRIKEKAKHE